MRPRKIITILLTAMGVMPSINLKTASCEAAPKISDPITLAWDRFEKSDYGACITLADRALKVKLSVSRSKAAFVKGRCLERSGDFDGAHQAFGLAVDLDPADSDACFNQLILSIKGLRLADANNELLACSRRFAKDPRVRELSDMLDGARETIRDGSESIEDLRRQIKESYLLWLKEQASSKANR